MSRMSLVVMLLLALVQGCASRGFPPLTENGIDPQAAALLQRSAERHGLAAWQQLQDVSVAYAGEWSWLVPRLQPELIDAGYRQKSEERLILGEGGLLGQSAADRYQPGKDRRIRMPQWRQRMLKVLCDASGHGRHERLYGAGLILDAQKRDGPSRV